MLLEFTVYTLGIMQIVLQVVATFFAFRIYSFNRLNRAWLAVALAFSLTAAARVITFSMRTLDISRLTTTDLLDSVVLPFAISSLLFLGMWSMKRNFESFEVVEKKVEEKIGGMSKRKKGRKR